MTEEDFLPILKVSPEQIRPKVAVCGDPERAGKIADRLNQPREVSYNREYRLINGKLDGREITVASHGVGASGAAVCFEELIKGGAKKIVRVGTAGSLDPEITDGDVVIATGAIREDGVSSQLVSGAYPAIADYRLVDSLTNTAEELGYEPRTGIVLTVGAFYPELEDLPSDYYSRTDAVAVEMEASILFLIASLNGVQAGGVMAIDGMAVEFDAGNYNPHRDIVSEGINKAIDLAVRTLAG
jgi:uridine phosphorylase